MRRLLRVVLEPEHYRVVSAATGKIGLEEAQAANPDVIILDLEMPDIPGLIVLQRLRKWSRTPVLILSARTDDDAKVGALDNGANDYMSTPFSTAELLARLRVLQRDIRGVPDQSPLVSGGWKIDTVLHEVTYREKKISLTEIEESLLLLLANYEGKTVTCQHLLRTIWGETSDERLHSLRVHIANLRRKLKVECAEVDIHAEGSDGYRLMLNPVLNLKTIAS